MVLRTSQIRRDSTVSAHENCYIMQFRAGDMEGLNVELNEVERGEEGEWRGGERTAEEGKRRSGK